ncbi:MAG: 3-dehydroquinate synthase family protein [Bacteroidota bacterium]
MLSKISYSINDLNVFFEHNTFDKVAVLCDDDTTKHCLPIIANLIPTAQLINVNSGESNKNWKNCMKIWDIFIEQEISRNSLLINLGGGMITDMGAFAASVYKRGITCINIPTSLLAMVDASIGAKTGIDYQNYKNIIGTYFESKLCIIDPIFLSTLEKRHLISGYMEMLKHGLIADLDYFHTLLDINIDTETSLTSLIKKSIEIKSSIVEQDPTEKGLRKVLNFGHSIGHALESYYMNEQEALLHGEAVLYGMIAALYISNMKYNYQSPHLNLLEQIAGKYLGKSTLTFDTNQVLEFLKQDKKNKNQQLLFVLIDDKNQVQYDCACTLDEVKNALNYLHD